MVLISSLIAMFLQALSAKLGIATGRDLAQACRDHYSKRTAIFLWMVCELAIAACDLAEVLGSAVALKLLFGIPLLLGVILTAFDVLLVLALQGRGFRLIEAFVVVLIGTIGVCFAYEIFFARPLWLEAAHGFLPRLEILRNKEMLYIAIGIIGATVMPHNLYLHSSIVQTRAFGENDRGRREAIKYSIIDSTVALGFALFINAAILTLGAAAFHTRGMNEVADIAEAYKLLSPVLGVSFASTLFAFALLASGQNSTLTGTLAGQIVMEGFLQIRLKPWIRRLVTRTIAILPAILVIGIAGEGKAHFVADLEPSGFEFPASVCRYSPGAVHQRAQQNGAVREFPIDDDRGMDRDGRDSVFQRRTAVADVPRRLTFDDPSRSPLYFAQFRRCARLFNAYGGEFKTG